MVTDKKFERLPHSSIRLTLTVPAATVAGEYEKVLGEYAKQVHIDGFRKGKVPVAVLERKLGEAIRVSAMGDIIEKCVEEALETAEAKPIVYSMPELEGRPEFAIDKDFTFVVTYDTYPEVKAGNVDGLTIEVPSVEIGKDDEARELDLLRDRNALVVDKASGAKAAKKDIVTVNYKEVDEAGAAIAGTEREDFTFELGSGNNVYDIDADVEGMKVGDTKVADKDYPSGFRYPELAGKKKRVEIALTALKEKKLPELDDEFAQDVSEKFKTLDDLKQDIRKHLEAQLEAKVKALRERKIVETLLERSEVDLPNSMVEAELKMRWEDLKRRMNVEDDARIESILSMSGKSRADLQNEWRPSAEKAIKTRIVIDKLIADGKYEVSDQDLEAEYGRIAAENSMTVDEVKDEYKRRNMGEYLVDHLKEDRLFAELLAKASIKKAKKMSYVDFFEEKE